MIIIISISEEIYKIILDLHFDKARENMLTILKTILERMKIDYIKLNIPQLCKKMKANGWTYDKKSRLQDKTIEDLDIRELCKILEQAPDKETRKMFIAVKVKDAAREVRQTRNEVAHSRFSSKITKELYDKSHETLKQHEVVFSEAIKKLQSRKKNNMRLRKYTRPRNK